MKQILKLIFTTILFSLSLTSQAQIDTIGYDNGEYASSIYSRNTPSLYWGISISPDILSTIGNQLSEVMLHTIESFDIELSIYSGTEYVPLTLLSTQSFTSDSTSGWNTITLDSTLTFDPSQTLWVTFHKNVPAYAGDYCSDITNNPYASWMSDDGSSWFNAVDYGFGNPFMVRAIFIHNNESITYIPEHTTRVFVHNKKIEILNAENSPVWIYSIDGHCLVNGKQNMKSYTAPTTGIYIVRVGNNAPCKIAVVQ